MTASHEGDTAVTEICVNVYLLSCYFFSVHAVQLMEPSFPNQ